MGRRAKRLTTANRKNCIWQQSPTIFWRLADAEEFFFSFFHDGRASYYYINPFVYVWAFVAMYIFKYGHRVLFSFFFSLPEKVPSRCYVLRLHRELTGYPGQLSHRVPWEALFDVYMVGGFKLNFFLYDIFTIFFSPFVFFFFLRWEIFRWPAL